MEPRVNIITLGVKSLERSLKFYRDGLGWKLSTASVGDFAIFKMSTGTAIALFPRKLLAADAKVKDKNGGGFSGVTLAHNVTSKKKVDRVIKEAVAAGAKLLKAPCEAEWGGYSGYFVDPDGHGWEVAYNPGKHFKLKNGKLVTL